MSHIPAESAFLIQDSSLGLVRRGCPPSSIIMSFRMFSSYVSCSSLVNPMSRTRTMWKLATVSRVSFNHKSQNSSLHSALAIARQNKGTLVTAPRSPPWLSRTWL